MLFLVASCQGLAMKSAVGSGRTPGTGFFKKSKSETRFGPLLMSSGRLVLFSGDLSTFFPVENVSQKMEKRFQKILTADPTVKILFSLRQKIRNKKLDKIHQQQNSAFSVLPTVLFIAEP